jgi:hypothetical protein
MNDCTAPTSAFRFPSRNANRGSNKQVAEGTCLVGTTYGTCPRSCRQRTLSGRRPATPTLTTWLVKGSASLVMKLLIRWGVETPSETVTQSQKWNLHGTVVGLHGCRAKMRTIAAWVCARTRTRRGVGCNTGTRKKGSSAGLALHNNTSPPPRCETQNSAHNTKRQGQTRLLSKSSTQIHTNEMIEIISRIPTSPLLRSTTDHNGFLSKQPMTIPADTKLLENLRQLVSPCLTTSCSSNTVASKTTSKKRVTFAACIDDYSPSCDSPLHRLDGIEQWKTLWYNYDELSMIKNEVYKTSSKLKRFLSSSCQSHGGAATPSLSVSDETRGLEHRCCPERQRRKYLTIRYVLHVARLPNVSNTVLADRARICSQWATQLAHAEACRDAARAYYYDDNNNKRLRDSNDDQDNSSSSSSDSDDSSCKRMRS